MKKPEIGAVGWRPTEVHPLAARFPVLEPEDLTALADDIKDNGLLHAIVIDDEGLLIDGRMRLAACEKAGVEPRFEKLNGHDPVAFIWAANAKRRQMTKGVIAMIAAMDLSTEAVDRMTGGKDQGKAKAARAAGVSPQRLSAALLVRKHAADLADRVISGDMPLDAAYARADAAKKARDWHDDGMKMLRKEDADLARRVAEEELTLDQARAMLVDRAKAEESSRDSVLLSMASAMRAASGLAESDTVKRLPEWMRTEAGREHQARYFKGGKAEVLERLKAARDGLDAIEELYAAMSDGDE